ncbi:unnamed protein product [Acanthoscelides obtectus]|uniref:DDE Tnp4 domain-containing protein n=1 Tax=Acanthoscelides obtectus TaxID=200917 RepID=A0A9P0MGT8_ACAOB|nr:unnamed protein product [Acanthoscelides obtectus]CAK1683238.1 hypothetical protein AOBTE_LOCUS34155 [Acanthoscelides obtectus]
MSEDFDGVTIEVAACYCKQEVAFSISSAAYCSIPTSEREWLNVAKAFEERWNFPHCLGSMDGKHIEIICPPNSGSKYYNYLHYYSIVLFAVVDAQYRFLYVHVGCQGRISDGGVFRHTSFGKRLMNKTLNLPQPENLPQRQTQQPYVFVADDAFPLTENICKPYTVDLNVGSAKRVFNYRLSSLHRVFHKKLDVKLDTVQNIVLACAYLHKFLRRNTLNRYSPTGTVDMEDIDAGRIIPGSWRNDGKQLPNLQRVGRNAKAIAKGVREEFMNYFMTDSGRVLWQDMYLNGHQLLQIKENSVSWLGMGDGVGKSDVDSSPVLNYDV